MAKKRIDAFIQPIETFKPQGKISYDELLRDHQRLSEYRKYAEVREKALLAEIERLKGEIALLLKPETNV